MNAAGTQQAALAAFDQARDRYVAAMQDVPEDALGFLIEGEDYALGGLAFHVNAVLEHYGVVLEAMVSSGFGEVEPSDPPGLVERAGEQAKEGLTPAQRGPVLAAGDRLHSSVKSLAGSLPAEDFQRRAQVRFEAGAVPLPTTAADVLGWLTGHYEEHVPQIQDLVGAWRAGGNG